MTSTTGEFFDEVSVIASFGDGVRNRVIYTGDAYVATSDNGAYAISLDLETWVGYSDPTLAFSALCNGASEVNFFAQGTPGLLIVSSGSSIPSIAPVSDSMYDFAQSPL